ncbi:MAG TPA: biotin/lipoyl-containing protein [Salinivirga sp.]|uniref:biotin/lipoyl-containing protein n=1 Tax=Salinivirga sp. TaxID=1970192 RepID=UPI002B48B933|nr:biotin/lipoyl-containing protein [Salinivirga sp.]HKK60081.1 biotin/lipoyl-containing protein [Salinivirga sp.]
MKTFKFIIKGQKYDIAVNETDENQLDVDVNGTTYKVEVEQAATSKKTPKLVRKPVSKKPGEGKLQKSQSGGHKVKAPLPGSIMKINVEPGDTVIKGQTLLVMEAMKMENNIQAEKEGTIANIKVKEGDSVLQDDILLEME